MNPKALTLTCPRCRSPYARSPLADPDAAVLGCACGTYPEIDGIPRLLDDSLRRPILARLTDDDTATARALALEWPSFDRGRERLRRSARVLAASGFRTLAAATRRAGVAVLREGPPAYCALIDRLERGMWGDWIKYRFSMPALEPLYALRAALTPGVATLEIGAGFGHGSHLLARAVGPEHLVCLDSVFSYLWLLRRRMVPGARVVCADASRGLPFADGDCPQAVASDAFHYLTDKPRAAAELRRVTGPGGTLILSHVANRLVPRPYDGASLDPAGYRGLFPNLDCRLYPDEALIRPRRYGEPLDLSANPTDASLAQVHDLSLVASGTGATFGRHALLPDPPTANLGLNPRLEAGVAPDAVLLTPRPASPAFTGLGPECFPGQGAQIPGARLVGGTLVLPDAQTLHLCLTDFLVLDMPPLYAQTPGVLVSAPGPRSESPYEHRNPLLSLD